MRMLLPLIAALSTTAALTPVSAEVAKARTGEILLGQCEADFETTAGKFYTGACLGYIVAVIDTFTLARSAKGKTSCLSASVSGSELKIKVISYLRDHPSEAEQPAPNLILQAVEPFFVECSSKSSGN